MITMIMWMGSKSRKGVSPKAAPEGACYKERCNISDNVSLFLCLFACARVCVCEGKRTCSLQLSCISTGCFLQLAFGINSLSQPKTFVLEFQDRPPTAYPICHYGQATVVYVVLINLKMLMRREQADTKQKTCKGHARTNVWSLVQWTF